MDLIITNMKQQFFRTVVLLTFAVLGLSCPVLSQSYTALWKSVATAREKDLPQSALQSIEKIVEQATRKGDGAQLLKAILIRRQISADISPDSAALVIPLLEKELAREQRPAMQALYHAALGSLYASQDSRKEEQAPSEAVRHFELSLQNPSLLAQQKTKNFLPLIVEGKDAGCFAQDLLNVVARFSAQGVAGVGGNEKENAGVARRLYHSALAEYRRLNMREAEFFMMLDSVEMNQNGTSERRKAAQKAAYEQLIRQFGGLDACSEAYVRLAAATDNAEEKYKLLQKGIARYPHSKRTPVLQNMLNNMTEPSFSVAIEGPQGYPGKVDSLYLTAHNATSTVVRFYKTGLTSESRELLGDRSDILKKVPHRLALEIPVTLPKGAPYEDVKQTVAFKVPESGIYFVTSEGKNAKSAPEIYYVSRLCVMNLSLSQNMSRLVACDALSGEPVGGAKLAFRDYRQNYRVTQTLTTDENGAALISLDRDRYGQVLASVSGDAFAQPVWVSRYPFDGTARRINGMKVALYTDRAIYRPGQSVKAGGFVYQQDEDSMHVMPQKPVELKLFDANGKQIASQQVTTDAFGSFGAGFDLPSSCLNGIFRISAGNGTTTFRVEQYKRPTFTVEFDDVKTAYQAGDTVRLKGTVKTYAGFPLQANRVALKVTRRYSPWCYWLSGGIRIMQTDTLQTDAEGRFTLPVALNIEDEAQMSDKAASRFYLFRVEAVATSDDGESQTAEYQLYAGNKPCMLSENIPDRLCRDKVTYTCTIYQKNAGGNEIAGKARYDLYAGKEKKASGVWDFNKPIPFSFFKNLPSAEYTLKVNPAERSDTLVQLTCKFALFSFDDKEPVGNNKLQLNYISQNFENGEAKLLLATPCEDAYVHYDLFDGNNRLLESKVIKLSNSSELFRYKYKEEYGNGLSATFGFVKDGTTYTQCVTFKKPVPEKFLSVKWKTFRNRLRPGQEETWNLQVTRKGKPVKASVLATLYDASLDKFQKHTLPFFFSYFHAVPMHVWTLQNRYRYGLSWSEVLKSLTVDDYDFSHLDESLFETYTTWGRRSLMPLGAMKTKRRMSANTLLMANTAHVGNAEADMSPVQAKVEVRTSDVAAAKAARAEETAGNEATSDALAARTDFSETAYFQPALTTDANGMVNISFKLPQSLTKWNFKAVAHTKAVDYGVMDTVATARKDFMLQPNMPRFLRNGDRTELAATVRNATDRKISGQAVMVIEDPETGARLNTRKTSFSVDAHGETVVRFPITADAAHPVVVVRMIAESGQFSDGEQHYLPILDDVQQVSESVPLSFVGRGTNMVDLKELFGGNITKVKQPRLTVEYTGNPAWLAVEALPTLSQPLSNDAVSLATAYYSLCLAALEAKENPEIETLARTWNETQNVDSVYLLLERNDDLKQIVLNETPWVAAADRERGRLAALGKLFDPLTLSYRCESYLDKLVLLQTSTGGWSWFRGMPANVWTTTEVVETLSRLRHLAQSEKVFNASKVDACISRAMKYLDAEVSRIVVELKKKERQSGKVPEVGSTLLRYLDICSRNGCKATQDRSYLISLLEKSVVYYNMYDKSLAVNILHSAGKEKAARLALQSLMEHTVSRSDVGRYFDSDRAPWSWNSYKIPTQVAALEAVSALSPSDTLTIQEMTRWLVQAKRTQTWDNPSSSVDAIYWLFLKGKMLSHAGGMALPKMNLTFTDGRGADISARVGEIGMPLSLGYFRKTLRQDQLPSQPQQLTIEKTVEPMSFGAVHAQYLVSASAVKSAAAGLSLTCAYSVRNGESWQQISETTNLHVGDLVRVRYELVADRDYDFVCLKEGRPACCEPLKVLSGYDWQSGCYRSVGDASTQYFFQQLRKGKHVLESEMRVDRTGSFSSAVPTVQCVYSPEFGGRAANVTLNVSK